MKPSVYWSFAQAPNSPGDPATFAVVVGLLAAIALVACYIPARRASRLDPIAVLRAD
jgi:putative ABC transport system permease protein